MLGSGKNKEQLVKAVTEVNARRVLQKVDATKLKAYYKDELRRDPVPPKAQMVDELAAVLDGAQPPPQPKPKPPQPQPQPQATKRKLCNRLAQDWLSRDELSELHQAIYGTLGSGKNKEELVKAVTEVNARSVQ